MKRTCPVSPRKDPTSRREPIDAVQSTATMSPTPLSAEGATSSAASTPDQGSLLPAWKPGQAIVFESSTSPGSSPSGCPSRELRSQQMISTQKCPEHSASGIAHLSPHRPRTTSSPPSSFCRPLAHKWNAPPVAAFPSSRMEKGDQLVGIRLAQHLPNSMYAITPPSEAGSSSGRAPPSSSASSTCPASPAVLSQAEMDQLVEGIDFSDVEEESGTSFEVEISRLVQLTKRREEASRSQAKGKGKATDPEWDHAPRPRTLLGSLATSNRINIDPSTYRRVSPPRAYSISAHPSLDANEDKVSNARSSSLAPEMSPERLESFMEFIDVSSDISIESSLASDDSIQIVEPETAKSPGPSAPAVAASVTSTNTTATRHQRWFAKPDSIKQKESFASSAKPPPVNEAPIKLGPRAQKAAQHKRKVEADRSLREKYKTVFDFTRTGGRTKPNLIYTNSADEVAKVLKAMDDGPYGFDLEWEPSKRRGVENPTALAQVCDGRTILLVHIARMSTFPKALKDFIEDPTKVKLGVQIAGDARKLSRDFGHTPRGLLELNNVGKLVDGPRYAGRILIGLQEMTGTYLDMYLPKEGAVRCGKWSGTIGAEQQHYAANDVWASLLVFRFLESLAGPAHAIMSQVSHDMSTASSFRATPRSVTGTAKSTAATPKPPATARVSTLSRGLSPRQQQAYDLYRTLTLQETTDAMCQTNAIKMSSVLWNLLVVFDGSTTLTNKADGGSSGEGAFFSMHTEMKQKLWKDVSDAWGTSNERFKAAHEAVVEKLAAELNLPVPWSNSS
ncbi:BZ3500_MvSof-1268-A1-R1_Chr2-1g04465 [Microbotryum saponariae]|uniref:BZ3500_MvSof-1268-A1-R1_Chr2-1g04465 protein n=1 Tax=Microbotryum saponariae TaxID=289078 RepID=A0A2X0KZG0_9BASI|nr:BZ3500_MvSof-1268-A1-R1_Chr2-1g04465 [Microbotryum saponariae]SCZ91781.1 BZ3501_MvSof-1269-A2-R1_Chr2-1g04121 [Microbotryum saponariae]